MICRCLVELLVSLSLASHVSAIQCDFQFIECNSDDLMDKTNITIPPTTTTSTTTTSAPIPHDAFDCEQNDDFIVEKQTTKSMVSPDQQYLFAKPDDDSYEDIESSCQVQRRTIQPKALNNIYNQLTRVVNTASLVQSITIEQCLSKAEPCNGSVVTPRGKKHICRQKHVKITLKALRDESNVVDEQFYYPSHCVCELVTVKKKKDSTLVQKCIPINPFLRS